MKPREPLNPVSHAIIPFIQFTASLDFPDNVKACGRSI